LPSVSTGNVPGTNSASSGKAAEARPSNITPPHSICTTTCCGLLPLTNPAIVPPAPCNNAFVLRTDLARYGTYRNKRYSRCSAMYPVTNARTGRIPISPFTSVLILRHIFSRGLPKAADFDTNCSKKYNEHMKIACAHVPLMILTSAKALRDYVPRCSSSRPAPYQGNVSFMIHFKLPKWQQKRVEQPPIVRRKVLSCDERPALRY